MNSLKKLFYVSVGCISIMAMTSCQDIIYDNIRKEVSLKSGSVLGSIRNIIRFTDNGEEYIYISNGANIHRKPTSKTTSGGWEKMNASRIGDYIINIAADSDNLYALTATWEENTSKGQNRWNGRAIYYSDDGGKNWAKVPGAEFHISPTATSGDAEILFLFCTNSVTKANRKAYYNYDEKGYTLSKTGATANLSANKAASCVTGYFFEAYSSRYGSAACEGNNGVYYYSKGTVLYACKGGTELSHTNVGKNIYSIAVTEDYVLVGTHGGIQHYKIKTDGSVGAQEDFPNNADAIMTNGYEVRALLAIDPSKKESENIIYASADFEGRSQQFNHICLWSTYGGNWNRD